MPKGRSKELIAKRDKDMFNRFVYLTEKERLRFDDAVSIIAENEYYISVGRCLQILRKQSQEREINIVPSLDPTKKHRKPKKALRKKANETT